MLLVSYRILGFWEYHSCIKKKEVNLNFDLITILRCVGKIFNYYEGRFGSTRLAYLRHFSVIEVPVPSHENEPSCICRLGISILSCF